LFLRVVPVVVVVVEVVDFRLLILSQLPFEGRRNPWIDVVGGLF